MVKIAILGAGRMGSWFAKELSPIYEIALYNRNPEKAKKLASILKNTIALVQLSELKNFEPDILINAVSLQNTIKAFEDAEKYLSRNCIIGDIASIKIGIPEYYIKSGRKFFSLHPMFGPTFANINALEDESVIIITESDARIAELFKVFFKKLGLDIFEYSFKEHDKIMAYSLTLPFASTLIFTACINPITVPGTTFKRHMKIAKGLLSEDDSLLTEILFNSHSLKELEKVTSKLEFLKHIIKGRDYEEAVRFFNKLRKNIK